MAWENRPNGKRYLYRSFRDADGRVRKQYLGSGTEAQAAFEAWEQEKAARQRQQARMKELSEEVRDWEARFKQIDKLTQESLAQVLLRSGFHNPKSRGIRRRRS